MNLSYFTARLPGYLDDHQCLPLAEESVVPAFRAVYLPTFSHDVILTLRCPPGQPSTLTVTSTEDFECHYHNPLERNRPHPDSKRGRRLARTPPPPPLTFPWPLAWWVVPGQRRPSALFQRVLPLPDAALARWRDALAGVSLLMADHEPEFEGRDGMVTIGEVRLLHGDAAFSAWHPPWGSPWQRYFTAMLDLCEIGADDPLVAALLATLRQYQ